MSADAAHAGVHDGRVQDEPIKILILVYGEHTAALARTSGLSKEEREGIDRAPFLEELQELRRRGVHLSAKQNKPLVLGKPKDLGIQVGRTELAIFQGGDRTRDPNPT